MAKVKSDAVMIDSFLKTGAYIDGTYFIRSDRVTNKGCKSFWKMYCPICSNDEYVKAGVCSGWFEAFSGSFQTGILPCRCSKAHYYSKEQREWKIKDILESEGEGVKFVRWKDQSYKFGVSKIILRCENHNEFERTIEAFINNKCYGCPECAIHGFRRESDAYLYIFLASGEVPFTGYGITNDFETRLKRHSQNLKRVGFEISNPLVIGMTGSDAMILERKIKDNFPKFSQNIEGFKREATYHDLFEDVIIFIKQELINKEYNETSNFNSQW